MEVCEVCGAFLIVGDAQSRIDDHLMGKQHVGYARLRSSLEEIMVGTLKFLSTHSLFYIFCLIVIYIIIYYRLIGLKIGKKKKGGEKKKGKKGVEMKIEIVADEIGEGMMIGT